MPTTAWGPAPISGMQKTNILRYCVHFHECYFSQIPGGNFLKSGKNVNGNVVFICCHNNS